MISALLLSTAVAAPSDRLSLPRYVERQTLHLALSEQLPSWSSCVPENNTVSFSVHLSLQIMPSGKIEGADAQIDGETAPCWAELAGDLSLAAHDGNSTWVEFDILIHSLNLVGPSNLKLDERQLEPLYLYLPPTLSSVERREVLRTLGIPSTSPPPIEEAR